MSDATNLKLGRFGNAGDLNIGGLKGGIKEEEVSAELKNIFNAYDVDNNDVLTDNEVQQLKQDVQDYAKHGKNSIFSQK